MHKNSITAHAVGFAVAAVATIAAPASAGVVSFIGTATATSRPFPDSSCAPLPFRGLADGSGGSNLGTFTYSHSVCILGATGPVVGSFKLDFGASSFDGLLDGVAVARVGVPGLFDQFFTYTLTGGTGQFFDATGSFTNIGTVDVRSGPPSRLELNFAGSINAPAIPEPASWAMMIIGFGVVGYAARRRRQFSRECPARFTPG